MFVGVIDINKCEEDARVPYNKLLEEGDSFKTVFWRDVRPAEAERNLFNLPSTIEELNEAWKIQNDMSNALEYYNEFTPKC